MKKLVIAEKPSVAATIAKALSVGGKKDGCYENEKWIVTWCRGHMLEIKTDERYAKWNREDLPIIPGHWQYEPIEENKNQLLVIYSLIRRDDVSVIVCATDAGREGELIFRLVYNASGTKKPIQRMWTSSLEEDAVRQAFEDLRDGHDYDNLYASALARSRADWLVGINATRFYSLYYGGPQQAGGIYSVGRVQTPTLNMIVTRDREIENFTSLLQQAVVKSFGTWALESMKFTDEKEAETCFNKVKDCPVRITSVERKDRKQSPPLLYSLTTLQQDANRRYGMSASHVLDVMQGLYEKKYLTYPRTDSNYITSDMKGTVMKIASSLYSHFLPGMKPHGIDRIADDSKVSDHYAVIPTMHYVKNMDSESFSPDEAKILYLVRCRLMIALSPWCEYSETSVKAECEGYEFSSSGRSEKVAGWRELDRTLLKSTQRETNVYPANIAAGQSYMAENTEMVNRDTKPPQHYTENTLLGAMDRAGAEDMPEDTERKGIGTSATRAGIIETLLKRGFIERQKKKNQSWLISTQKGRNLIDMVDDKLKDVKTTARWEWRLKDIEEGKDNTATFEKDISDEMAELIRTQASFVEEAGKSAKVVVGVCPWCGSPVIDQGLVCKCSNEECGGTLFKKNRYFGDRALSDKELKLLFSGKKIKRTRVSASSGKKYEAMFSLKKEKGERQYYDFAQDFGSLPIWK